MTRDIVWTTQFKKDYKLAMKRHLNIDLLDDIIRRYRAEIHCLKRIKTTHSPVTGSGIVNAIFSRTGY